MQLKILTAKGLATLATIPQPDARRPRRQELQTPKPLPTLATPPQPYARRASSPALKLEGVKAVSVTEYVPAAADVLAWSVVPHAAIPGARVGVPASRAELLQLPPTGAVASNLITMEVGLPRVSGLMIKIGRAS